MRSRRSSKLEKASTLLEPVINSLGIASGVRLSRIKKDWDRIFEKPLSIHMWPSKFSEDILLINVDSPAWVHHLGYHKPAIISKLGRYGVTDIRFRVGRISKKECPPSESGNLPELGSEDLCFIEGLASEIGDDSLRSAIRGAVEKSIRATIGQKKQG